MRALGQFASPYFVASAGNPQRTPTYASGCRPARASSSSHLAPVPVPKLAHYHARSSRRRGREGSSIIVATMNFAERMSRLGTESAFGVLARAKALERQGREIVHLEIGEPDFDTPAHIREAAKRALDDGATHYGPSAGLPELREAIAKDVGSTRNIPVAPE